jgi:hypothetical protein
VYGVLIRVVSRCVTRSTFFNAHHTTLNKHILHINPPTHTSHQPHIVCCALAHGSSTDTEGGFVALGLALMLHLCGVLLAMKWAKNGTHGKWCMNVCVWMYINISTFFKRLSTSNIFRISQNKTPWMQCWIKSQIHGRTNESYASIHRYMQIRT